MRLREQSDTSLRPPPLAPSVPHPRAWVLSMRGCDLVNKAEEEIRECIDDEQVRSAPLWSLYRADRDVDHQVCPDLFQFLSQQV
jgi:hypothetical protein